MINGPSKTHTGAEHGHYNFFDKLWLEAIINALYEAGLQHDILNLLYIENETADIAVKVNYFLTDRFKVNKVVMQGSVWGGLKCTTLMDKLNKILHNKDTLMYKRTEHLMSNIGIT